MSDSLRLTSAILLTTLSGTTQFSYGDVLEEAFKDGKASFDARYRYETSDDSTNEDATASTLRTRLGFTTSDKFALSAHIDFEHVTRVGDPEYNSTQNGLTQFAVVADPDAEELNQAFLKYKLSDEINAKYGRQRIILDNARFVGNVGWRQNEQTFDALRFTLQPSETLSIGLANLQQTNTITGGEVDMNTNLINVGYSGIPGGNLSLYAYLIEFNATPSNSISTYGLRYKGAAEHYLYTVEYATQSDYGDNPGDISADYLFGEFGYKIGESTKAFIALESLGSDNGNVGFQTPLATKHAFNGWADKFLGTPDNGLQDLYLKAVTKVGGIKLIAVYHDFSAANGGTDYGTELDLVAIKQVTKSTKALIKFADYDANTFSADTQKVWLALEVTLTQ